MPCLKVYTPSGATIKLVDKFDVQAASREWKLTSYAKNQNIPIVSPDFTSFLFTS